MQLSRFSCRIASFPISFRALVVGMKNGTLKDKRKRLAINIVKFAELPNIRLFQDGTTDYNINVLLPQQSIDGFVKPLFYIKVEKNLKTVLALANVTGMEDDFLVGSVSTSVSEVCRLHECGAKLDKYFHFNHWF